MTDVDVSDHEPGRTDGDGHVRCAACDYRWPCPDVRAQPRALERVEAEILGALDIGVGFYVERRLPDGADAEGTVRGTVVGFYDDDEGRRCLRVLAFPGGRRRVWGLRVDEVEPASVRGPNSAAIRAEARRLAGLVHRSKGSVAPEELEILADALDLLKAC